MNIQPPQLKGYRTSTLLSQEEDYSIYLGIRLVDEQSVIIKLPTERHPSDDCLKKLQKDFNIGSQLSIQHVNEYLTLETLPHSLATIQKLPQDSQQLSALIPKAGFELTSFLEIAIALTSSIESIHNQQIVHNNIRPYNIFVNLQSMQVQLADFTLASKIEEEAAEPLQLNQHIKNLTYISPERTGRINRSVNYRSDLYSLGTILYEMLTGKPPFSHTDAMTIIYAHINQIPTPIHDVNKHVPKTLSHIIQKLLSKQANKRYQNINVLKKDLIQCLTSLKISKTIRPFPIARKDFSSILCFSNRLYGREKEIQTLLKTLDRIDPKGTEVILVSGYSGIGKTSLINEIQRDLILRSGYFLTGKFKINNNTAYSAISQAFSNLVNQILSENDRSVQSWKQDLLKALGPNGKIFINVIPEMESILGKQPPIEKLGPAETQNRFNQVFQNVIQVFGKRNSPIVLFLDDLQWADFASLTLLKNITTSADENSLLLIGTYRDNEIDAQHPTQLTIDEIKSAGTPIHTITLKPLKKNEINSWVSDTLHCSRGTTEPLSQLIYEKTEGNPFFCKFFLKILYEDKLLYMSEENRWEWNIEKIQKEKVSENVASALLSHIHNLPTETIHALALAACIGNNFDINLFKLIVNKKTIEEASELIKKALNLSLLIRANDTCYFVHDKIQEACYSINTKDKAKNTHLDIGRKMLKLYKKIKHEKIFDIVDQYNIGKDLIKSSEEKTLLATLNLTAGEKAKSTTAYKNSRLYLKTAKSLLQKNSWRDNYQLTYKIHLLYAELNYINKEIEKAETLVKILMENTNGNYDKAKVTEMQLTQYIFLGKLNQAKKIALLGLNLLDIKMPKKSNVFLRWIKTQKLRLKLRNIQPESLINNPLVTDKRILTASRILGYFFELGHNTGDVTLCLYGVLKQVELSLRYGHTPESATGYISYSLLLQEVSTNFELAYRFAQLGLKLSLQERFNNDNILCRIHYHYGYQLHWNENWNNPLFHFDKAINSAWISGNFSILGYACTQMLFFGPMLSIKSGLKNFEKYEKFVKIINYQDANNAITLHKKFWKNLSEKTENPLMLDDENFSESDCLKQIRDNKYLSGIGYYEIIKFVLAFTFEEYQQAVQRMEQAERSLSAILAFAWNVEFSICRFLCLSTLYSSAEKREKIEFKRILTMEYKKMKSRSKHCPKNFLHLSLLMEAEINRLKNNTYKASLLYEKAIEAAENSGYLRYEALTNEITAKYYILTNRKKIAKIYLKKALYLYNRWGASAKATHLKHTYNDLFSTPDPIEQIHNPDLLDFHSILKASQAISGEIHLDNLVKKILSTIVENTGVKHGYLLTKKGNNLVVESEGSVSDTEFTKKTPVNVNDLKELLAISIINVVKNTRKTLHYRTTEHFNEFKKDPYIIKKKPKSILCMPIVKQDNLLAILYLENDLMENIFTENQLKMLTILGTQAAISLENMYYYRQEIEQQTKQHQIDLAHYSRLATAGELASGFAHELNQPLGIIVQYIGGCLQRLYQGNAEKNIIEAMEIVEAQAERAGAIINSLKRFLKKDTMAKTANDVKILLQDTLMLANNYITEHNIEVTIDLENTLSKLFADEIQIKQLLLNIIINSIDAMKDNIERPRELAIVAKELDKKLYITITDTGTGIDKEHQNEIFNPFYTTKSDGMGMGLAICRSIIEAHDGTLCATPAKKGSEFQIILPLNSSAAPVYGLP